MSLIFNVKDHSYKSTDDLTIDWVSVTTVVSHFKKSFDAEAVAKKVIKNKKSKWYGLSSKEVVTIWNTESLRALTLGTFYHNQRESDLCSFASIEREGVTVPVFKPNDLDNGLKIAPIQKLDPGIYPEHMVYLRSAGICGQSDLVEVVNGKVNVIDYKTNKEIKTESYVDWEGKSEKLLDPVSGLDDCNFNHYALQLSIYMYIILKHNPKLMPGKIMIHHITFEVESTDQWGYPIAKLDINDEPIVKDVNAIEVPYLKDEVISIMHYLHDNKHKIKKK